LKRKSFVSVSVSVCSFGWIEDGRIRKNKKINSHLQKDFQEEKRRDCVVQSLFVEDVLLFFFK